MKKVSVLLLMGLALTLSMNAQQLRVDETDEFTGSVKKFTEYYNLAKTSVGQLRGSVLRVDEYTFLRIYSSADIGCSGAVGNYMTLLFSDGSNIKLEDLADIDCGDGAESMYDLSKLDLSKLTKIRLRQSEYYTDGVVYGTYSLQQLVNLTK